MDFHTIVNDLSGSNDSYVAVFIIYLAQLQKKLINDKNRQLKTRKSIFCPDAHAIESRHQQLR